jgi:hypothetical protein
MQVVFPELYNNPQPITLQGIPRSSSAVFPLRSTESRYRPLTREQRAALRGQSLVPQPVPTPEEALTQYYEAQITQQVSEANNGMIELPAQVLQFVIFSVIVIVACLMVSLFVSRQQIKFCKKQYGGVFATELKNDAFANEIKNYLYGP